MTKEVLKLALEAAYLAGFDASGEGYNAEYPFGDHKKDPEQDAAWVKDRDNALRQALAQPEQFKPDYNTEAVLVEEMQRMAKRIEELEKPVECMCGICKLTQRRTLTNEEVLAQPDYRAVKTYHEGEPVYGAQQEPVGKFARFTDGIWREVTDGSAGVHLYTTPPQPEQNLSCKSVQARLATAWGYVKAQSQQEPVAWRTFDGEGGYEYRSYDMNEQYKQEWEQRNPNHKGWVEPLYISPPQRQWVGLTDEEVAYFSYVLDHWTITHIRGIEAKLKAKNEL